MVSVTLPYSFCDSGDIITLLIYFQQSRDPFRTPMLWTNQQKAGFCMPDTTPWLPINDDYRSKNVEVGKLIKQWSLPANGTFKTLHIFSVTPFSINQGIYFI